ncbi:ABC transporter permease [Intrasporangium calvum]|uniref:Transport permease protein n=1 Tax=Intrasporangium calvum TaxID=53358 RepID=A0ABT5GER2_9MICO|nr:ABC transporter permease [Intrasporangium calvum]MDC5696748.1 ABC transporter permease [Intrasporangium calvum]
MTDTAPTPAAVPAGLEPKPLSPEDSQALAERHGLMQIGVRPPLFAYLRELWHKRQFIWTLASAQAYAAHQKYLLGQVWAVLNPLLLVASYYLIFGVLLDIRRGTQNYIGFLTIGIFLFSFIASSMTSGAKAITSNIGLVRSLRFPRAVLPIAVTVTQLIHVLPALGVLLLLMLVTGERPQLEWLMLPVAVALLFLNVLGITFFLARIVEISRDVGNLIPVLTRLLRYISGVFFSIDHYAGHPVVHAVMAFQPVSLPLTITREALLAEFALTPSNWLLALAWALVLPTTGFLFFWRAEARYGRAS